MPIAYGILIILRILKKIEKVQMRATKLLRAMKGVSYGEILKKLHLPTLKYRRLRGDIIEVFKNITGKYDS